jgi:hypothetical protein
MYNNYYKYNMETTFDFKLTTSKYVYNMNSSTKLIIKQVNYATAILYFTDNINNIINIPNGIVIHEYDYQNNSKKVILKPYNNLYALCWSDNYIVELDKNIIINIKNQRRWNIQS